ncbi:phage protein [Vibrio maritimus]|uniref:Phage protein n=1 Tax=Vibrio maritimus TaxID=990268 RepID=A0A090SGF0_9VIBR|nr:phage protein [Vibrio maritimus]
MYVHSGVGDISYGGNIWKGVGNLGAIGAIKQSSESETAGISLTLSGIDQAIIDTTFQENFVLKEVVIHIATMQDDAKTVRVMDRLFTGFCTSADVQAGETNAVQLQVANKMDKWKNGKTDRFSHVNHLSRNPGDNFFKHLAATSTMDVRWGNTVTSQRFRY